jgi:methyl-accepting chemotaxis protein
VRKYLHWWCCRSDRYTVISELGAGVVDQLRTGDTRNIAPGHKGKFGIAGRLITPFVAISLLTTALLGTISFAAIWQALSLSLEQKSRIVTRNLSRVIAEPLSMGEFDQMMGVLTDAQKADPDMSYAHVITADGMAVVTTDVNLKNVRLNRNDFEKAALQAKEILLHDQPGSDGFECVAPIGAQLGFLRVGFSRRSVIQSASNAEIPVAGIGVVLLALGIGIYFGLIKRDIIAPIANAVRMSLRISQGDLQETAAVARDDEIGQLMGAMNDMVEYLREMARVADSIANRDLRVRVGARSSTDVFGSAFTKMVESLHGIIEELTEGGQGLSAAAQQLAATSGEQSVMLSEHASAIQESLATLEEIRTIVTQTSEQAKSVVEISERSLDVSKSGQEALQEAIAAMEKIRDQVAEIAQNIVALRTKTIQIGQITASVNDIAGQSNLLAVNATMEAVKAGQVGRGFAVVATEVKNLAMQSKKATADVHRFLGEIQKAMGSTVTVTEEGSKRVESGVDQVHKIGANFNQLYRVIAESSNAALQIAQATHQEVAGIEQIAQGMRGILQAAQASVAGAQQQNTTAQNLSSLATSLNNIVRSYRLQ